MSHINPAIILNMAAAGFLAAAALTGCDGSGGATKMKEPKRKARTLWENRCAACHGMEGRGDGPAVPGIKAEATPRDLTDPTWQKAVTDDYIARVIVKGGPAVGLSHVMAPNLDLEDDPRVVEELVEIIRDLEEKEQATSNP